MIYLHYARPDPVISPINLGSVNRLEVNQNDWALKSVNNFMPPFLHYAANPIFVCCNLDL